MHVDSKSTGSINQATCKMNDNILESKLELNDLGVPTGTARRIHVDSTSILRRYVKD